MKKSDREEPPRFPITFHPSSNGEFMPRAANERDRRGDALYRRLVDEKAKRLGMTRRQFAESASGMVGALFVMNEVYGCSGSKPSAADARASEVGGSEAGFSPDAGYDVAEDVSAADAADAAADAGYDVTPEAVEDGAEADSLMSGAEFIFDVQTHNQVPTPPWTASTCAMNTPMLCPTSYISGLFVDSDTQVACLSGYPAARQNDTPSIQARGKIKEISDRLDGTARLLIHTNVRPEDGAVALDDMAQDAATFPIAAWKVYPSATSGQGLDTDAYGRPFIERARQLGVRVIAAHRGIGTDNGEWMGTYSPRDVAIAAAANPDIKFLVYHSGWQMGVPEDHPFNVADPSPKGLDRLIKAVLDNGLGPMGNLYAELGTTWFNLMTDPNQAAHVLGKLLKYLGPDRILWGTDSYNNGGPQAQIQAFRAFQIPESMQALYGYPALTADTKRKIFGLNAATVYDVDAQVLRRKLTQDDISKIVLARRNDPGAIHRGPRTHGPRTRREYLAFLRWSGRA
jgi:predicted TIM-barrel fold metal-dependent hydrolase